ncbi:hypothetical protein BMF94_0499 [Rhodotorula taiwanensis]|uniref:Uncharacterized protein n=1 Tax=Rhodotorula taiwanensis TaxID=741276 RepID=A0A2S5BHS6_9BASI|nr:hypothetical protein BMF94_0499 [Rhodotorula taiwanensis]
MAALIKQYLCCCLPQSSSSQDQHSQQDERQPLLNPDILPTTTEQQQAEQDQLRHILHLAEQHVIVVQDETPQPPPPSSLGGGGPTRSRPPPALGIVLDHLDDRHRNPNGIPPIPLESVTAPISATTSRSRRRREGRTVAFDESAPRPPRTWGRRVVHLDRNTWTELDAQGSSAATRHSGRKRNGDGAAGQRPASSHSMKTLPRASRPAGFSTLGAGDDDSEDLTPREGDDDRDDREQDQDEEEDDLASTRFGTVDSYQTARESGWHSTRQHEAESSASGRRTGRRHARDLWSHDGADASATNRQELADAIERLEQEIDTWTLPDHGPFVADLGKSGNNAD